MFNAKAILGDYFKPINICSEIKKEITSNGLNLIFIDPTDCSLPFNLIRELKKNLSNVDLIINIALGTDYNRNIKNVILDPLSHVESFQKYSGFIDDNHFFNKENIIELARNNDNMGLRLKLREKYELNLRDIGFTHFDYKHIRNYYDLIFATSHEKGIEFWQKANKIRFDGQRTIDF